jgi:hypothetical protein
MSGEGQWQKIRINSTKIFFRIAVLFRRVTLCGFTSNLQPCQSTKTFCYAIPLSAEARCKRRVSGKKFELILQELILKLLFICRSVTRRGFHSKSVIMPRNQNFLLTQYLYPRKLDAKEG